MLDLLAERRRTTGEMADAFPKLSRFAVMKHLRVLERAELIIVSREGRKRWNALNPVPLREVFRRWVGKYEAIWSDALLDIRDAVESRSRGRADAGPADAVSNEPKSTRPAGPTGSSPEAAGPFPQGPPPKRGKGATS